MQYNKLEKAFIIGLELKQGQDVTHLEYRAIPEWDSIGHMALIAELEEVFDVSFSTEQVLNLSSFDRAIQILQELGIDDFSE